MLAKDAGKATMLHSPHRQPLPQGVGGLHDQLRCGRLNDHQNVAFAERFGEFQLALVPGKIAGNELLDIRDDREVSRGVDHRRGRQQQTQAYHRPRMTVAQLHDAGD
jgi:hypothetical protein